MMDETADNMDTTAGQPGEKRPVGRPKGHPKTGGRPKGSRNKLPAEFRQYIDQRGRPLELLAAIARGAKVTAADPSDPTAKVRIYPSLGERTAAARTLLDRLLPALKATEVTGAGGGPLEFKSNGHGLEDENAEVVRRFLFLAECARRAEASPDEPPATVEGWAEPAEAPAEAPAPEPLPVGHVEERGSHTLRLCERLADGRERWAATNGDGRTVGTAFGRDRLVEMIEEGNGDGES